MSHGGINLNQVFRQDAHLVNYSPYGPPVDTVSSRVSLTNQHQRPDNTVNRKDISGWRSPSSFYHNRKVERMGYVAVRRFNPGNGYGWVSSGPGSWSYTTNWSSATVFPQKLEDRCVNRALNKLLGDDSAGYGEDFATWQQTADMVSEKKTIIAHSVNKFKSRYPLDWLKVRKLTSFGKKALGSIPQRWLELQYGWVPALADVDSGMKIIADRLNNNSGRRHVIAASKETQSHSLGPSRDDYIVENGQPILGNLVRNDEFRSFVRFDFAIGNPALHAAAQLGLVNPAQLAWNLVPFTFVVDWFLPVDGCLSALSAPWGLRFIGGSLTRVLKSSRRFTPLLTPYIPPSEGGLEVAGDMRKDEFSIDRRVLSSFPGPRMPRFKNPLSLQHLANATSLLATAFR